LGTAPDFTSIGQIHRQRLAQQFAACITSRCVPFHLPRSTF